MICPYRKVTKTFTATDNSQVIAEEYATCYETLCPWYYKNISNFDGKEYELCERVESEK